MSSNAYWWTALGLGFVVAIAALVLLQMLLDQVRRVEHATTEVLRVAVQVAGNTVNTSQLVTTSKGLDALADEAERHEQFLREVTGIRG